MTVWKLIELFELSKWITQTIVLNKWIEPARNFKKCQCTFRVDEAAVAQKYVAHGIGSAMSTVQPVNDKNDSMSAQNQQIRIDELSENLDWAKLIRVNIHHLIRCICLCIETPVPFVSFISNIHAYLYSY